MKQMILLLLAVYSLIINQSNKSIIHKKIPPASRIEASKKRSPTAHLNTYPMIAPSFPLEMIMYTGGYNPVYVRMLENAK